jgi:hypothetical protein
MLQQFDLRGIHNIKLVWALDLQLDGPAHFRPRGEYIQNVLHVIQQERDDDELNTGTISMHIHSLTNICHLLLGICP